MRLNPNFAFFTRRHGTRRQQAHTRVGHSANRVASVSELHISAPNIDWDDQLPLDVLELWDCFDYNITVVEKPILGRCSFYGKDKKMHPGEYEFTIDTAHPDFSVLDTNFSEHDPEHKTFNVIALDNGQFAAQPNNRCQFFDNSLVDNDNLKRPDFKVCTQNYAVETLPKWWSVGHTEEWAYRTEEEVKESDL